MPDSERNEITMDELASALVEDPTGTWKGPNLGTVVLPAKHPTLFPMGQLVITPAAFEEIQALDPALIPVLLQRHGSGDWSEMDAEDQAENRWSIGMLRNGRMTEAPYARVFSAYTYPAKRENGAEEPIKFWVITEANRSVTTILLPSDY